MNETKPPLSTEMQEETAIPWTTRLYGFLPYETGSFFFRSLLSMRWLRELLFKNRIKLIRTFHDALPSKLDVEQVVTRSLITGVLPNWRLYALFTADKSTFEKWMDVSGSEHISNNLEQSGAIILNTHFGALKVLPPLLVRMGYEVHCIGVGDLLSSLGLEERHKMSRSSLTRNQGGFFAKELFRANKVIKSGKLVHVAGDGILGSNKLSFPVGSRTCEFASGFAMMAVTTGAAVVPVFSQLSESGKISVRFLAPLEDDLSLSQEERIHNLVQQYVNLYTDLYFQDPGSVRWRNMTRYIKSKPLASSEEN